jgi:hypothetical protein
MPRLEAAGYRSQVGEGCDCSPLMRGVELRGGRVSHRGSMVPVGERGWRTWHELGWRREGKRDPGSVSRLGRLVAQRDGPKATRLKGRIGHRGDWADWARTEEKFFSK